jgi:hypothetical protein
MSRATRRQKLEAKLKQLESDFLDLLLDALKKCASGEWGLFGQNDAALEQYSPRLQAQLSSGVAETLLQLGDEITAARASLGIQEPFKPFATYLAYRQRRAPNEPGEPKLASELLVELGQS